MSFVNPLALWLAIIPALVLLAYFIRANTREKHVATLFLWEEAFRKSVARAPSFKLRRIISALIATLIATLVLMALCEPRAKFLRSGRPVVILLDNSASMAARDDADASRFEDAVKLAKRIVLHKSDAQEVLVMTTAPHARVVCPYVTDAKVALRALDALEQSQAPCDALAALEQARFLQTAREDASILFLSDGVFRDAQLFAQRIDGDQTFHWTSLGQPRGNIAITAFSSRRNPSAIDSFESFIELANYTDQPVDVALELDLDDSPIDMPTYRLEPQEVIAKVVSNNAPAGGQLSALLTLADPNAPEQLNARTDDDQASCKLEEFPQLKILLHGRHSLFVETVFRTQPNVEVEVVEDIPESVPDGTLLVLCEETPQTLPKGRVAILEPRNSCELFDLDEPLDQTVVEDSIDYELTRYVNFRNATITNARPLTPSADYDAQVYANAPETPLVIKLTPIASDSNDVYYVFNFSCESAALALQSLFPILFANLVADARGVSDYDYANVTEVVREESDLSHGLFDHSAPSQEIALAQAQTPLWFILAIVATILACVEFYLYARRKLE